jgi:UDP-N-acetyl-D-mannosaminuronic acid transferase (WecB/TagA/CpsF family)
VRRSGDRFSERSEASRAALAAEAQPEWAYRLAQEPQRLWRRYLVDSPKVLGIFIAKYSARATRG